MKYTVLLEPEADGGYVVSVPALPGCISQGDTREEAITNVRDAIDTWIEGATQVGMAIPEDSFDVQVCIV